MNKINFLFPKFFLVAGSVFASSLFIFPSYSIAQQNEGAGEALSEWAILEKEYKALREDRDNVLAQVRVAYDERNKALEEVRKTAEKIGAVRAENEDLRRKMSDLKRSKELIEDKLMQIELEQKNLSDQVDSMHVLNKTLAQENETFRNRPIEAEKIKMQIPKDVMNITMERDKLIRENADLHYNLGVMLSKQGDYERASIEFTRAIELRPTDAAAHFNLGRLYADYLPEKEKAIRHFKTYLELKPHAEDSSWVRSFIATFKASQGHEKLF